LNDVDEMCKKCTKCFLKIAIECIPTKIVTIRNNDKTEIMLFKNVENSTNFNFYSNGKLIPLTSDHIYI